MSEGTANERIKALARAGKGRNAGEISFWELSDGQVVFSMRMQVGQHEFKIPPKTSLERLLVATEEVVEGLRETKPS